LVLADTQPRQVGTPARTSVLLRARPRANVPLGYERDDVSSNLVDRAPSGYETDVIATLSRLIAPNAPQIGRRRFPEPATWVSSKPYGTFV
jgi:hypothetical protein